MGLMDDLFGTGEEEREREDTDPDLYAIVCRGPDGKKRSQPDEIESGEWSWNTDPPNKEQFKYEYGDVLESGIVYECVPHYKTEDGARPDFDDKQWVYEPEDRAPTDDLEEIKHELREIKEGDGGRPEDVEELLIYDIRDQKGAEQALDKLFELQDRKESDRKNFFEDADLDDSKEIMSAAFINMMDSYNSVGEAVNDIFSGALQRPDGTPRVGPMAEPGSEPAEQQQDRQEPEPEPEPEPSPAKAVYEEATQGADAEEPERRLDLGEDADAETREEMAEELGVSEEEPPADQAETAQADAEPVEADADPGGMSAAPVGPEPPEEAEETVTEGEVVEDSEVPAEPAVVEKAASDGGEAEIEQCQHVKDDGERCGNPAGDDGYCHVEGHGPDDPADPEEVEA